MAAQKLATPERSMPTVTSDSNGVKKALEHLFRSVADGDYYPRAFNSAEQSLRTAFRKFGNDSVLNVDYDGSRASFFYEGMILSFSGASERALASHLYKKTNERYGDALEATITFGVSGMTHYVGIAGGLDGPLAQLGFLQAQSKLRSVHLVDENPVQVLYDMAKLYEYDINRIEEIMRSVGYAAMRGRSSLFEGGPKIRLTVGEMLAELRSASDDGRYFIYLSNEFFMPVYLKDGYVQHLNSSGNARPRTSRIDLGTMWEQAKGTAEVMRTIAANDSIEDGSIVIFAKGNGPEVLAYEKLEGGFTVAFFISAPNNRGRGLGREGTNITTSIDAELQARLVNTLLTNNP